MPDRSYVSRINQIDAAQLDSEIYKILKSQTREITKLCPQEKVEQWQPEIDAFLKFVIWCFSLGSSKSTFGQRLLDLNYARLNRRKAVFFLILTVVPTYVQDKFADRRRIPGFDNQARLRSSIELIANCVHLMSFLNLLVFLHRGRQPSIVERLLGVSSQTATKSRPRQIGYSYMTRELLWHGLMELFTVGLPMINFHYVKQSILRFWTKNTRDPTMRLSRPLMTLSTRCPYCDEIPILPRHANCEHIYCYYCISAHFAATGSFQCHACGTELHADNVKIYTTNNADTTPAVEK